MEIVIIFLRVIQVVLLFFAARSVLAIGVNKKMYRIAIKEIGHSEWYLKWSLPEFIFLKPFTFRINKYIEKVRNEKA